MRAKMKAKSSHPLALLLPDAATNRSFPKHLLSAQSSLQLSFSPI